MAAVKVNRGMPRPEAPASSLPKDQWRDLAIVRELWAKSQLPFDCRLLRQVAADAPLMAPELGYASPEAFLREELQLDPDLVNRVVGWLEQEQPAEAVPLELAVAAAQAQPLPAHRRPTAEEAEAKVANSHFKPANQVSSDSWDRILPRLARDAPEILERVKAGEFSSARAAAIEAGIIKPVPTVRLVADMAVVAGKLCQHLTQQQRIQLIDLLAPDL
jgi:hypothetical protein